MIKKLFIITLFFVPLFNTIGTNKDFFEKENKHKFQRNTIRALDDKGLISIVNSVKPNDYVFIDIREKMECRRERIKNSINIPMSELDKTDISSIKHKKAIFCCKSGFKTRKSANKILALGFKEAYYLKGGIEQWKRNGFKTIIDKSAPIDIIRQVHFVIGTMVTLGVILGYFVSPYFLILSLTGGTGLIISSFTGYCLLGKLLMLLPYNKV